MGTSKKRHPAPIRKASRSPIDKGIRAAVCHDHYSAHQGVEHDDRNILVLGSRIIGLQVALDVTEAFLTARFSNEERHGRRLNKVKEIENKEFR
jgi:ribose 5-phosphate isomerase B